MHLPKLPQLPGFPGFSWWLLPPVPEVSLVAEMSAWVETLSMMVFLAVPILLTWFTKVSRGPAMPASCNSIDQISWNFPISSKDLGVRQAQNVQPCPKKNAKEPRKIVLEITHDRQCDPNGDFLGTASSTTLQPRLGNRFNQLKEKSKKPWLSFEFVEVSWMIMF